LSLDDNSQDDKKNKKRKKKITELVKEAEKFMREINTEVQMEGCVDKFDGDF
jgi:uncharacterized FlaG/YvyC family protein